MGFCLFFEDDWTYVKKKQIKSRKLKWERLLPYELKRYHGVHATYQVVVFLESVVCFLYEHIAKSCDG